MAASMAVRSSPTTVPSTLGSEVATGIGAVIGRSVRQPATSETARVKAIK